MTVLVTGATGTLGGLLIDRLLQNGYALRVLSRRPFRAAERIPGGCEVVEWHPDVEPPTAAAFDGIETVIHLMGEPPLASDPRRGDRFAASRVGALRLINEGLAGRRWRLVVASLVIGSPSEGEVLTEASPRDALGQPGAADILRFEAAAHEARAQGASVAVVRLGMLLTADGALARLEQDARMGRRCDLSRSLVPAIDPEDAAELIAGLAQRTDLEGVIHGVAPEPLKGSDLALLLASRRRVPLTRPMSRRGLFRRYGLLAPLLLNRGRVVPQRLAEIGARFTHPDPKASAARVLEALAAARQAQRPLWQDLLPERMTPFLRRA